MTLSLESQNEKSENIKSRKKYKNIYLKLGKRFIAGGNLNVFDLRKSSQQREKQTMIQLYNKTKLLKGVYKGTKIPAK